MWYFPYTSTLFIGVSRSSKVGIVSSNTSSIAQISEAIVFLGQHLKGMPCLVHHGGLEYHQLCEYFFVQLQLTLVIYICVCVLF